MQIPEERIEELRRLYKEGYGQDLTYAEAAEMGHRLLTLYRLLTRPLPSDGRPPQKLPAQNGP